MRRPSVLRFGMLFASVIALFGSLFFGGAAQAATCTGGYPASTCGTFINVTIVTPGGQLVFHTADIFHPGETVIVDVHSAVVQVGSFTADAHGAVAGSVTVPTNLPPGQHELVLTGTISGVTSSVPFTVVGTPAAALGTTTPTSSLPFTGAVVLPLVGAGAGLLLAGSVLLLVLRRRKPTLTAS